MGGIMLRKQHSDCLQANEELQRGNNTKESRTTSNENLKQQHNLLGIHEKHGYHAIVIYLKKDKYESRFYVTIMPPQGLLRIILGVMVREQKMERNILIP